MRVLARRYNRNLSVSLRDPLRVHAMTSHAQAKFEQALAVHQQGQLARAQALYEAVLATQPGHFDALHLLGVIAAQTSNHQRAVELIDRAIALRPDNAAFYINRGNALQALRQ